MVHVSFTLWNLIRAVNPPLCPHLDLRLPKEQLHSGLLDPITLAIFPFSSLDTIFYNLGHLSPHSACYRHRTPPTTPQLRIGAML